MKVLIFSVICVCSSLISTAQGKSSIKFGKIAPEDFTVSSPLIDSNVNAVIISDIGSSEFVGNDKGWFSLIFKRHKRIKILNNKGFDAARVDMYLYTNGTATEKLENLNANTYNLENGTVVTTKFDAKSLFEEQLRKNIVTKKFTFPAVKAGSIIEYTYSIKSDFIFNLQPWEFQDEYPCLWSEYAVALPEFFNYVFLSHGYLPLAGITKQSRVQTFVVREQGIGMNNAPRTFNLSALITDSKWTLKDVPALKPESYTSSISNHIARIEFQLSEYRFPNQANESIMGTWASVSEKLLEREDFGQAFNRANLWLNDDMKSIVKGATSIEEKTRRIYEFVRDNFTCTNTYARYLEDKVTLKEIFKRKSGSVADINILLLAMLRHEGIEAEPVLLSLRSRGTVNPVYPLLDKFNYLVCEVNTGEKYVYLDASVPVLGFNKLPEQCYNGTALVVSKGQPTPISLISDSLLESKQTSVFIINDEKAGITGSFMSRLGYYESLDLREKIGKNKKDDYVKEVKSRLGDNMKIDILEIDSLLLYDEPVAVKYDFKMNTEEDIIYFNPLFGQALTHNPFKSTNGSILLKCPMPAMRSLCWIWRFPKDMRWMNYLNQFVIS